MRRTFTLASLAAAGVLLLAVPASAHVTVNPNSAAQGSYTEVNVRVPNEQDKADTTKIEFFLPTDHPIASVSTESVPGWTVSVVKAKLAKPLTTDDGQVTEAVSEIVWSGGAIRPGQFQDFALSLGPLPSDTSSLTFKALQTYSDGTVVRWIQPSVPGQPEPDNPAPVLKLTAPAATADSSTGASAGGGTNAADAGAGGGGSSEATSPTVTTAASVSSNSDTLARVLGGIGLVVGLLGIGFGYLGWRRGGSGGSGTAGTVGNSGQ
ncbi:YcnI family copper-binding membrane protein [Streptacidiphilus cavernicola]|uniref:YcnI family protein n=1 Tax=Streptacidiphilus cavernicola TaxID=3342716 RepID=A0ABV6VW60_9ACTN